MFINIEGRRCCKIVVLLLLFYLFMLHVIWYNKKHYVIYNYTCITKLTVSKRPVQQYT